ncbi:hypothetical protein RhiirA4_512690 [Rhizophagus irregularis]|uniref:BED-type domain-containing protein n=1 Tax=Rhizophagus irregularis TaxID=588596 RepID=A0A2I1GC56_9GLOM|nr:hypothetical protein RhiirA4_512690 [Rhizophagus irregularis]
MSLIWGGHAIQGAKISEGRYETTCAYCNYFWKEGSHKDLEAHFANESEGNITINLEHLEQVTAKKRKLNNNTGIRTKISDFHESITFTELKNHEIDRACVKAFAVCGIAWHVIENPFFIKFLKTLRPGYTPPSKEVLSACDGWTNSANKNILNYHSQLNKKKGSALKEEAKACDISDGGLKKWCIYVYDEFADSVCLLCFFLHPSYTVSPPHNEFRFNEFDLTCYLLKADILPKDEHDEIDSDLGAETQILFNTYERT